MNADIQVGLRLARERLRGSSAPLVLCASAVVVFAIAAIERRSNAATAADDTLSGAVFGVALPLLAYLSSERLCLGRRLEQSVDSVVRYGAERRAAVLGVLLGSALCMAFASVILTIAGLVGAHAPGSTGFARDLLVSVEIAAVSGAVYGVWFGAASALGRRGGGRKWALILDYAFGAGSSSFAALWPRAHVRNLLGGEAVLGWPQASAWLALLVIGMLSIALGIRRTAE